MPSRYIARFLRAVAQQLDYNTREEAAAVLKSQTEVTTLALRMGRLEGKLDIVLAIMGTTLFVMTSAVASFLLGVAG
jgi:hypothetical protein